MSCLNDKVYVPDNYYIRLVFNIGHLDDNWSKFKQMCENFVEELQTFIKSLVENNIKGYHFVKQSNDICGSYEYEHRNATFIRWIMEDEIVLRVQNSSHDPNKWTFEELNIIIDRFVDYVNEHITSNDVNGYIKLIRR